MDLTNILNTKDGAGLPHPLRIPLDMPKRGFLASSRDHHPHSPAASDFISDREGSPHSSDSPSASDHSSTAFSIRSVPTPMQGQNANMAFGNIHPPDGLNVACRGPGRPSSGDPASKAFPCSVCGKGFARRSDLARHERIHSGIRPHVCDYPGCDKQFIQRSALTVHARVHTGEKPHMCETCGKPFSDSSSLARHRRIHSGKRPYKCPYADCQKTFTRRTTLTRHQNHHTGTISEAAAATAAALAARPSLPRPGRPPRSPNARPLGRPPNDSLPSSAASTPSPSQRHASLSPSRELHHPTYAMPRQIIDYSNVFRANGGVTSHPASLMNGELQPLTPRPTPTTTPTIPSVIVPGMNRQPPTSNPAYLPPMLKPKLDIQRQGSPHMSGITHMSHYGSPHYSPGYHSPVYAPYQNEEQFSFPPLPMQPNPGYQNHHSTQQGYYGDSHLRRPQSNDSLNSYENERRLPQMF